jgi:hypothetical protein
VVTIPRVLFARLAISSSSIISVCRLATQPNHCERRDDIQLRICNHQCLTPAPSKDVKYQAVQRQNFCSSLHILDILFEGGMVTHGIRHYQRAASRRNPSEVDYPVSKDLARSLRGQRCLACALGRNHSQCRSRSVDSRLRRNDKHAVYGSV